MPKDEECRNRRGETHGKKGGETVRDTCRDSERHPHSFTAGRAEALGERWGEVGEENGGGKRMGRENVSPKVKAARRRQQGSRSVRKWSFNGLPSPRQICHPRLLCSSPRAFRLLITSFQPAPSIPCLMLIISSVPWLEALWAPRPIFQRRRPRPGRGRPTRAWH